MKSSLVFLSLVLLTACSKTPKLESNFELTVDGVSAIKEHATDENIDKLQKSLLETIVVIDQACDFSRFLNETISSNSPGTLTSTSQASTSTKSNNETSISTISTTAIEPISIPGKIFECSADSRSCILKEAQEGNSQVQYILILRDYLREKYKMKHQAIWRYELTEKTDKPISFMRNLRDTVSITDTKLLCEQQIVQREK
jgi:hypothetical protein